MEIWHRVSFSCQDNVEEKIIALELAYKKNPLPGGSYTLHIDIAESDPSWSNLVPLIEEKNALDMYETIFNEAEIRGADWLRLIPSFEQGYPEPQDTWIETPLNYENHCRRCGAGYVQKTSFRLAKEPRLGKYDFMSLYWTYVLFATSQVFETLAKYGITGYEHWDAIIHKANLPSQVISQIYVTHVSQPGLSANAMIRPEACPQCGITKFGYHRRGYMQFYRDALLLDLDMQLIFDWFGSGGRAAFREILISNRLAQIILDQRWKGVALKPVVLI